MQYSLCVKKILRYNQNMKFEGPKQPSQEDVAKIEEERALSDAGLVKSGAEKRNDEKGNKILEATDEQIEEAREDMEGEYSEKQEKNRLDSFISMIEFKIKNKLPDNKEELFRNFYELVPKDIGDTMVASRVKSTDKHMSLFRYSREGIKEMLEKELYGATIKEIDNYLGKEMEEMENKFSNEYFDEHLDKQHQELLEASNGLQNGSFGIPLEKIELLIEEKNAELIYHTEKGTPEWKNIKQERDILRNFAERLSLELYKNSPKENITQEEIMKQLKNDAKYLSGGPGSESETENTEMYKRTIDDFEKGNTADALEAIEFSISWAQDKSKELRNRDSVIKKLTKEVLNKRYGDDSMHGINQELRKLRSYRKFLIGRKLNEEIPKTTEERSEEQEIPPKESKESLEQKELLNQQIENNADSEARSLQTDVALFLDSLDRWNVNETLENYKYELDEILYRKDIEYKEGENIEIPEQNKTILEPLLKLRKELDYWATFTEPQVKIFREKFVKYLQDTFGIEENRVKQGEKYAKKGQQAVRVEETNDKSMDNLIKEPIASGYKINEKLWDYYKDKFDKENRQKQEKLESIKKTASQDEFDRIYDKYSKWNRSHSFSQKIRPAKVVIYRYKE